MYRRTGIVLFLIFGLWAAWIYPKDVTYVRGKSVNYGDHTVETVYVYCGKAIPILADGEYHEDIPSGAFYMQGECRKAARSHLAWVIMLGLTGLVCLIIGLVRGKAPKVPAIDAVLERLPKPEDLQKDTSVR